MKRDAALRNMHANKHPDARACQGAAGALAMPFIQKFSAL